MIKITIEGTTQTVGDTKLHLEFDAPNMAPDNFTKSVNLILINAVEQFGEAVKKKYPGQN